MRWAFEPFVRIVEGTVWEGWQSRWIRGVVVEAVRR